MGKAMHEVKQSAHSVHATECADHFVASWLWPLQEEFAQKCVAHSREARASGRAWLSGARVVGAAMGGAGMMAELNPVPLGRCRGPWRERRHRTVPSAPAGGFPMRPFLSRPLLQRASSVHPKSPDVCGWVPGTCRATAGTVTRRRPALYSLLFAGKLHIPYLKNVCDRSDK